MIKFTLGIAIIAFSTIVGLFQYFENVDMIEVKERSLAQSISKKDMYQRIERRAQGLIETSMLRGEDKKNKIERLLNIGEPNLTFEFVGQGQNVQSVDALYRHNFKIEGPSDFKGLMDTLKALNATPGFVVYKVCQGCSKSRKTYEAGQHSTLIEGHLYVYDPKLL